MVTINEFLNIDLRVGKVLSAEEHPLAKKPMYILKVSFGEEGERTIVAGIRDKYSKEELVGKKIVCVFNLEPKEVAGIASNGMILAAEDDSTISVLVLDRDVKEGSRVH